MFTIIINLNLEIKLITKKIKRLKYTEIQNPTKN